MPSFTDTFGGATINPVLLSYISYTISADLTLVWPLEAAPNDSVAADKIDVITAVDNLSVTVPKADQTSVGQDILIRNPGIHTFFVYDQDGIEIGQVASGEAWYFVLIDNSTDAGVWYAVQFGMGTSSATAASLAGAGLRADFSALDQNLLTTSLIADYTANAGDRATVLKNAGGSVVWTLSSAVTMGNGYFFYAINAGSGSVVLTPSGGQTIDGDVNKTLAPGESAVVFSDGANYFTLGYGRSLVNTVTATAINIAGTGLLFLNASQIAAQIQDWSGTITGNRILDYGGGVGYWFVWNNSTGAFTVTARVNGLDVGVIVPQGSFSILRSNGTSMAIAFTASSGTVTEVDTTADLTGGPITTTGTLGLSNTGVSAGTYGSISQIPVLGVTAVGRLSTATSVALSIANSAAVSSTTLRGIITDPTGTGSLVFAQTPTIADANLTSVPVAPTAAPGTNTTQLGTTAFVTAAIAAAIAGIAGFSTGDIKNTLNATLESGWVYLNGQTIGNGASGATGRANADTANLFAFLWTNYNNTLCPVSGGRGGSAAADFAANKTIQLLDARGAVLAGVDAMGTASNANKLGSGATGGFAGTATLGATGGEKSHQLTIAEMPRHSHSSWEGLANAGGAGNNTVLPGNTGFTGGDGVHNTVQWTLVVNVIVKL